MRMSKHSCHMINSLPQVHNLHPTACGRLIVKEDLLRDPNDQSKQIRFSAGPTKNLLVIGTPGQHPTASVVFENSMRRSAHRSRLSRPGADRNNQR